MSLRLLVFVFFLLLGAFEYLRVNQIKEYGFLLFSLPIWVGVGFWLYDRLKRQGLAGLLPDKFGSIYLWDRSIAWPLTLYLCLMFSGLLRAMFFEIKPLRTDLAVFAVMGTIVVFFYMVVVDLLNTECRKDLVGMVGMSVLVLVLSNVLLVLFGFGNVGSESQYTIKFENTVGWLDYRIIFPLTSSGQYLSVLAGALVVSAAAFIVKIKDLKVRVLSLVAILCGLYVILGHGSRMSLVMLLLVGAIAVLGRMNRACYQLGLLFVVFPVLLVWGDLGSIIQSIVDFTGVNAQRQAGDISTFSNRDIIFYTTMHYFFVNADWWEMFFGFGSHGQIRSGASDVYAVFFWTNYSDPFNKTTHNTILQNLVDYGLVGMTAFIWLLGSMIRKLSVLASCYNDVSSYACLLALLYLIGMASTESVITYYCFPVFSLFIFIVMNVVFQEKEKMLGVPSVKDSKC